MIDLNDVELLRKHAKVVRDALVEKAPPGWSGTVKAMKKHKDISNPFALAWYMKNKGEKPHYKPERKRKKKKRK